MSAPSQDSAAETAEQAKAKTGSVAEKGQKKVSETTEAAKKNAVEAKVSKIEITCAVQYLAVFVPLRILSSLRLC